MTMEFGTDDLATDAPKMLGFLQKFLGTGGGTDHGTSDAFPADPTTAPAPSPEQSRIVILSGVASGRPYLIDADTSIWTLRWNGTIGQAFRNGGLIAGGGAGAGINQLVVAQGKVYCILSTGQTQSFDPGRASLYNASLPPFWTTPGGGAPPPSPVVAPLPPMPSVMPGSSGKVIQVANALTIAAAIAAAVDGDTVRLETGVVYTTGLPTDKIRTAIFLDMNGGTMDFSAVPYGSLAGGGQGALVPRTHFKIANGTITGVAMQETTPSNCCAIRHDGSVYVWVDHMRIHHCQCGLGGDGVGRTKYFVTDTTLDSCGIPDGGYTHGAYWGSDVDVELVRVNSTNPLQGHAIKARGPNFSWDGGSADAANASILDRSDGSSTVDVIKNVAFTKRADSPNHAVISYAPESTSRGTAGMAITGGSIAALCANPLWQGMGGTITLSGVALSGNPIVAEGGIKVI